MSGLRTEPAAIASEVLPVKALIPVQHHRQTITSGNQPYPSPRHWNASSAYEG
ncbi:hypothetical protein [Laspinema olomoucense]|uniref:hypothetical protein n=1 Tax=Laspinema olomoucense TaxID=3231600 RepID=UPI0021BAF57B|nr:hypothetical protein [Laspinema sp. D3a]MCT7986789.1 hypothetical protein [Laspinema sp. D3a]